MYFMSICLCLNAISFQFSSCFIFFEANIYCQAGNSEVLSLWSYQSICFELMLEKGRKMLVIIIFPFSHHNFHRSIDKKFSYYFLTSPKAIYVPMGCKRIHDLETEQHGSNAEINQWFTMMLSVRFTFYLICQF